MYDPFYLLSAIIKYLFYFIIFILVINLIFGKNTKEHHSHWNTLLKNFDFSTKEFYNLLRIEIESQGITGVEIREKTYKEGSMFTFSRLYLNVSWKDFEYDICGAKFANGFFVSSWLNFKDAPAKIFISKIPLFGNWLVKKIYPVTYFSRDTASMFMTFVHSSILKVVDDITSNKGIKPLTEAERKPIMKDVFARK